ncbi:epididymal-specific lipocalin-12 isoform X2 [Nannospalax galili]|uniref:epididymal-specific lipocalin-12 isoform X2 n=1 Tax=Nannospalax galili TaxID=1026970 RepID=UPI00111C74A9|nr:epididymal-specific lipocalin-12 isoform X2 [Nannospalax galili]XP_029423590.1 epididymal-specific lipocalin-12 isoform X2 [Nannospalax galili]
MGRTPDIDWTIPQQLLFKLQPRSPATKKDQEARCNIYKKMDRVLLNPFISLFELKNNSHIQVTNSMTRGKHCDAWSYMLIPATKPGQFTVDIKGSRPGADSEEVQVIETDYTKFALMLSSRQTSSQTIIRVSLLGRKWRLPYKTINKFVCLTRAQNLTKNNFVFPDVTDWLTDPSVC